MEVPRMGNEGVPLRVELGPRDVQAGQVTIVRHDTGDRMAIARGDSEKRIVDLLDNLQESMFQKAKRLKEELTSKACDMGTLRKNLDKRVGFREAIICEKACDHKIKEGARA